MSEAPHDEHATGVEIALIGMAGRFPGADDVDAFWRNIHEGVESVMSFSEAELRAQGVGADQLDDPRYVKAGVRLDGMDRFDASFFGYSPREARQFDPQHRLFLETAWEALEHAGYGEPGANALTGIYAGCGANLYLMRHLLPSIDWRSSDIATLLGLMNGNDADALVSRVAYKLDLRGPSVSVQTACSTSLAAVHLACRGLLNHEADMALAGGVWLNLLQQGGYLHQPGAILSPDGHCRAFDHRAEGTVIGSGVGIVVLKRLGDALADGDTIHAVIKGSALNNDGAAKVGYAAPSVDGQTEVIVAAQAMAGVSADAIGYVEAHGTGTSLGDPIEVAALTQAFRRSSDRRGYCALGSLKTNVGHLDAAAGVAGLIKAALAVRQGVLPPSLNFERPNPQIDFAGSPFYVNTQARSWPVTGGPRHAGVSSFGMGGTNVHVVLGQAPVAEPPREADGGPQLLLISARSAAALDASARRLAEHLARQPERRLVDVAHTLRLGRRRFTHRMAVLARDLPEAQRVLSTRDAAGCFEGRVLSERPTVAFLFPGQGAQHAGMGRALYEREAVFREAVDHCCEWLRGPLGVDLRTVLLPDAGVETDAAARLAQTALTQPALFVIEHAMARQWLHWGLRPDAMLGHSIGEYVAACVAGVFTLEDALRTVALRGRLLQATEAGAMLAVGLAEPAILALAGDGALHGCDLAAVNGDELCVLSGRAEAIEAARELLQARGVAARPLHVSHAFHSVLVEPMLVEFERHLASVRLSAPRIPFLSNVTGNWITADEACNPAYWVRHVRATVRFADGLRELLAKPDRVLLEVGPGDTLGTLARRHVQAGGERAILSSQCHPQRSGWNADQPARCLAQLWACGIDVDGYPFERGGRVPLPTYPFERQSHWIDAPQAGVPAPVHDPAPGRLDMDDWFHVPVWKQSPLPAPARPRAAGVVLLLGVADGLSAALGNELVASGCTVVQVEAGAAYRAVGPDRHAAPWAERDAFVRLLQEVERAHGPIAEICHLWSLGAEAGPLGAMQERGLHSLIALAPAMEAAGLTEGDRRLTITVVTNAVEDVTGSEALHPEKASVHGPCKVIPQEYPRLDCRLIDVVLPPARAEAWLPLARQIVGEMGRRVGDVGVGELVAFRGPHRWVREHAPVRCEVSSASGLRARGTYLITGGLGGMGLSFARHLAERWQARLVLLGRTPPGNEVQQQLREFEAAGAQVLVLQADVADAAQLRHALDQARGRFGSFDGVVHAAGVPGGGLLAQRSRAAIGHVLAPKVAGTLNLLDALADETPSFVLLCSSLTAVTGGFGQVDYGAANGVLDALAHRAARDGRRRVIAVNWDVWREVGMGAGQALPDELGVAPAQAGELLERVLGGPPVARLLVSTIALERQFAQMRSPSLSAAVLAEPKAARTRQARPVLTTPYAAPAGELEEGLAALWSEFLGMAPVGVDDHFFELGGDSLLAIQLLAKVRGRYGVDLHPAEFFKAPTVAGLAMLVETRLIEEIENEGPAGADRPVV